MEEATRQPQSQVSTNNLALEKSPRFVRLCFRVGEKNLLRGNSSDNLKGIKPTNSTQNLSNETKYKHECGINFSIFYGTGEDRHGYKQVLFKK